MINEQNLDRQRAKRGIEDRMYNKAAESKEAV